MKSHVLYYKCNKEKESPGISRGFILLAINEQVRDFA